MLTPIFPGIVYIVLLAKMFPFEILDRYVPHVAELIFQHMDIDALVRLRFVNKQWKKTIDKILFGEKMAVARYLQAASDGQQDICRCGHTHVMYIMMTLLDPPCFSTFSQTLGVFLQSSLFFA